MESLKRHLIQVVSVLVGCIAALWLLPNWVQLTLTAALVVILLASAFFAGVILALARGPMHQKPVKLQHASYLDVGQNQHASDQTARTERKRTTAIFSRDLDQILDQVLELILRDYVVYWYKDLSGNDMQPVLSNIREDLWEVIINLSERLSHIDQVKFVSNDAVEKLLEHLQSIEEVVAHNNAIPTTGRDIARFTLHSCLRDEKRELKFLRNLSETLLVLTLPKQYVQCKATLHLLREILACSVLLPTVEMLCDPSYINETLVSWLEYRENLAEQHTRNYTYAPTFETFCEMIISCTSVEDLKQIRYKILTEIMHATTINNLKKSQGMEAQKEFAPRGTAKGHMLMGRNLKRYINQLTYAKNICEKKIAKCGGPDYKSYGTDIAESKRLPGKTVLSFRVIMASAEARSYFRKFLEDQHSLVDFWVAVEEMQSAPRAAKHKIGSVIFQDFLSGSNDTLRGKLDKSIVKSIKAFLVGNKRPDGFWEAQAVVKAILEDNYYPSFVVSSLYHNFVSTLKSDGSVASNRERVPSMDASHQSNVLEGSFAYVEHTSYAHMKLEQTTERLENKMQALQAMETSRKADPKVIEKLEKEVESLKQERRQLESHIEHTDIWCANIGHWIAQVHSVQFAEDKSVMAPFVVIVVHLSGTPLNQAQHSSATGWVVSRTLQQFYSLHHKLVQIGAWLKKYELPSESKFPFFKSSEAEFAEKAKPILDRYLNVVLKDERMSDSQALYNFLLPSAEYLKESTPIKKRTGLSRLFGKKSSEVEDEEISPFLYDVDSKSDDKKDSIAGPLYKLIREVFDPSGMFKVLRRTLIVFVQVTFGLSINRQIRETVQWLFSDSMLTYYLQIFRDSMWPNGVLAEALPSKTDDEKLEMRQLARQKILRNIPDALTNLVGQRNACQGAVKVFDMVQNKQINKHLFYTLLETFIMELCPELEDSRPVIDSESDSERTFQRDRHKAQQSALHMSKHMPMRRF